MVFHLAQRAKTRLGTSALMNQERRNTQRKSKNKILPIKKLGKNQDYIVHNSNFWYTN